VSSARHNATIGQLCNRALAAVAEDNLATRAHLLAQRATASAAVGDLSELATRSAEALGLAEASGDPAAVLSAIRARHAACVAPERVDARLDLANRALRLTEAGGPPMAALWGTLWQIDAAFLVGDSAAVDAQLLQLESVVGRVGWRLGQWHLARLRAARDALAGRFGDAIDHINAARELADRMGDPSAKALCRMFPTEIARLRGIPEDVPAELFAASAEGPPLPVIRAAVAASALLIGERDKALNIYVELRDQAETLPPDPGRLSFLTFCADLACAFDDTEHAPRLSRLLAPYAHYFSVGTSGVVFSQGAMARYLGRLSLMVGRLDEAERHLNSAITLNAAAGAQPYVALSRLDLAGVLRRRARGHDLERARALATDALEVTHRLGMPGPERIAMEVIADVDAASARASTLTVREQEIAALIGAELSNADIARRLSLSERTVESHVRNILNRIGGSTRGNIRVWLRESGGVEPTKRPTRTRTPS
jgi:DNA-binding CsgD family transcriptional regulator